MNLKSHREKVNELKTQFKIACSNHEEQLRQLKSEETHLQNVEEAIEIYQTVSQIVQQKAHEKITGVVTACLQSVFYDEDYSLKIKFQKKRNKTEANIVLVKDGHEIEDPMEADSGGVISVAAFVLMLSCLMLQKPPVRKLMLLDEPFKFVSEEYLPNVRQMLEKLSRDFDIQFIIVTHIRELVTGKVVQL